MERDNNKHVCLHEADLAQMATTLTTVCKDVKEVKTFLIGTNGEGILRKVKGLGTHIKIQWWLIGSIYVGLIIWLIRTELGG